MAFAKMGGDLFLRSTFLGLSVALFLVLSVLFINVNLSSAITTNFVSAPVSSPSPSASPSPTATPNPNDGDRATGHVEYVIGGINREADFNVREPRGRFAAHGHFRYEDSTDAEYKVDVKCARVSGDSVWIAGPVTKASNPSWVGQWLFAKAQDLARPGDSMDKVWGSFISPDPTCVKTNSMATPTDGPFTVLDGNIKAKDK